MTEPAKWPWYPNNCRCGTPVNRVQCARCAAKEAYEIADLAQRSRDLLTRSVKTGDEIDAMAYAQACADRDVALALLSQKRREVDELRARVARLEQDLILSKQTFVR